MPQLTLRPYQVLALRHVLQRLNAGQRRLYVVQPPGTGKTVLLTRLAASRLDQGRVLVLVHRQDLVRQTERAFQHEGLTVGVLMQSRRTFDTPVVVATVQSLKPEVLAQLLTASTTPVTTILIDEAHHAVPGSPYARSIVAVEQAAAPLTVSVVGFTATPFRADAQSMLALLPTCAFERTIPEMQQQGYLAPLTWHPLPLDLDLEALALHTRSGSVDYAEPALATALRHEAFIQQIARQVALLLQRRPTLVFAASVRHAERLTEAFVQQGLRAATVTGRMSSKERERLYTAWRNGEIQVVCTCALLTEGFNFPGIAALVIARPTRSLVLYLQMLGRGMRPAEGKTDCLVIDVLGNQLDLGQQVVLPHVVKRDGDPGQESAHLPRPQKRDPRARTRAAVGTEEGPDLALLDPIHHSPYCWMPYTHGCFHGFFAQVNWEVVVVIERDPDQSGLYRSRLALRRQKLASDQHWIESGYFPLRQQVERVHEAARAHYQEAFGGKEAEWRKKPATDRQLEALARSQPTLAQRARAEGWTSGQVSLRLSWGWVRWVVTHPPPGEPSPEAEGAGAEGNGVIRTPRARKD